MQNQGEFRIHVGRNGPSTGEIKDGRALHAGRLLAMRTVHEIERGSETLSPAVRTRMSR